MQQPEKSHNADTAKSISAPYRAWLWPANAAALAICLAGAGLVLWVLRAEHPDQSGIFPPCPFHYLTGLYCPGCGSLRATHHLLNAKLVSAIDSNALALAALPFLAWVFLSQTLTALGKRPLPGARRLLSTGWPVILTIIFAFWIARNLPYFPFNLLAP